MIYDTVVDAETCSALFTRTMSWMCGCNNILYVCVCLKYIILYYRLTRRRHVLWSCKWIIFVPFSVGACVRAGSGVALGMPSIGKTFGGLSCYVRLKNTHIYKLYNNYCYMHSNNIIIKLCTKTLYISGVMYLHRRCCHTLYQLQAVLNVIYSRANGFLQYLRHHSR